MRLYSIIKKGSKEDPQWMVHKGFGEGVIIDYEDDNLPVFQPYPEFIDKKQLEDFECELVEVEVKIL